MSSRPTHSIVAILGTRYRDFHIEEQVLGPLGVELRSGPGATPAEIISVAGDATVILAGSAPRFDRAVLDRLPCRGIVRYGVGTDAIDLDAARQAGIWVARVSDYATEAVAIHAVTLALAGVRRLTQAHARVHRGDWGFGDLQPLHLPSAMTAGVVGFGRIGRRAATLLAGLGFRVLGHDPFATVDAAEPATLEELLAGCDVVTLHVPGPPDGTPLLDAERLALLRPGSVLVNTARGSLIDQDALARSMRGGRPAVAALDVFPAEPPDPEGFTGLQERLILTPHMAWYTEESEADLRHQAVAEVERLLRGERPLDVVVDPGGVPA